MISRRSFLALAGTLPAVPETEPLPVLELVSMPAPRVLTVTLPDGRGQLFTIPRDVRCVIDCRAVVGKNGRIERWEAVRVT